MREVPREAMVLVNPARCRAMTSMYPSARMSWREPESLAKFMAKRPLLLWYTGVSEVLMYLGFSSVRMRPPKATTFPRRSRMGNMARAR